MSNALACYDYSIFHSQIIKSWATKVGSGYDLTEVYDQLTSSLVGVINQHGAHTRVGFKFHRDNVELVGTLSMYADEALDAIQSMRGTVLSGRIDF